MIFKSTQFTDGNGNVSDKLTWAFKENKFFGNTKDVMKTSMVNDFTVAMDQYKTEFDAFDQSVRRNMASGMEWAEAMTHARNEVSFTSEELQRTCMQMEDYYKATTDGVIGEDKLNESWGRFNAQQTEVQNNLQKTQKGFKGLSTSTKALFANIGAELAIALAIQGAIKLFQAADEAWGLTSATRIEKMETAVNDYNDALSESSDNIKTIESLESEFESLSKGVDSSGRNIGLTNEQFARYNEIANQLADLSPVLIQGYTAEGNAIIDRNKAIEDGIKAQKDYAAAATSAFTTNVTGNDIINGVQDKIKEAQKNLKKSVNAGTSILSARGSNVGSYSSDLTTLYGGKSFDLDKTSLTEMKKLAEMRGKYLSDLIDSDKYTKEEISNIKAAGDAFHQGLLEIESQYQPVYEWLSTAMNTAAEEGALSITESIPESLRDAYEEGLKYISTQDLSAVEMRATGSDLATKLQTFYSGATSYGEKYLGIQEKITAAQEELETNIDGVNDSVDIENYETKVEGYLDAIEKLAEELRAEGGVVNEALADIIESEYLDAVNFAQENILTLADAFNPLIDKIQEAQSVKEEFDAAIAGGDYDTALDGIKEIYDTILDGENNLGHGSQTAWIGAEQILGKDTLKELDYNWNAVESRLNSMSTLLSGGESGTSAFFNLLRNSREELNKISEGAVKIDRATGAISFDFDEDKWAEYADALNMSEETLTALVNASRQFANIDLGDPTTIKTAISESDTGFHNIDTDQVYDFYDTVEAKALQAGYSVTEFKDRAADLKSVGVHLIDLEADAKTLASTFAEMNSALATTNSDGTFTVNAEQIAVQMFEMGRSVDEVMATIEKFNKDGAIKLKTEKTGDVSWEDYIKNLNEEYNKTLESESKNPFDSLATSADKFTAAVNQLVIAMGMIPDIDIKSNIDELEADVNNFARSYEGLDSEGKSEATKQINKRIKEEEKTIKQLQKVVNDPNNKLSRKEEKTVQAEINEATKRVNALKKSVKTVTKTNLEADLEVSKESMKNMEEQADEFAKEKKIKINTEVDSKDTNDKLEEIQDNVDKIEQEKEIEVGIEDSATNPISRIKSLLNTIKNKNVTIGVQLAAGASAIIANAKAALASLKYEGTSNRRKQSHFPSMASGSIRGQLGPKGRGGLTLTGELGTELVWSPSEGISYLVGQYGPEMVDLPADAVVYPADETRRIIGDTIPRNRFNFGSLASGHMTFGSAGNVGGSYTPSYSGSSSKSSSSSSKSSSSSESAYEKAKKELDHQFAMGYITEKQYYDKLLALYNQYKGQLAKEIDDQRAALEDLRKAWIDAYESAKDLLDHQLEMGEISESQYYDKLKALGDEYYKGRSDYANEYRDHLEELKDARNEAYEAQLEDLDKQLEKETITVEKYFNEIQKLQDKYLTGTEMAKDLEDALEDMYDTLQDALDEMRDDIDQQIEDNDLFNLWVDGGDTAVDMLKDFRDQIEKDGRKYFETEKEWKEYLLELDRDIAESEKDHAEKRQEQLNTVLDLVEDLVRQEAEDYKDALEDQVDSYNDLIDAKKKALQLTERELSYNEEMADYATQISKLQSEIELLARDDSRAAAAERAAKEDELANLLKEQQKAQREETLNRTEESLDDQSELFEKLINKQIEIVENWENNQSAVLETVMKEIENRETNDLLNRLIAFNGEHGDAMLSTIETAFNDLDTLIAEYGDDVESIVEVLQKGVNVHVTGGIISTDQTDYAHTQAETLSKPITHHSGLATGFTGDGADHKQHEVYRLLTDDELVFNRDDQMRIASQLQVLDTIKTSFASLNKNINPQPTQTNQSVELVVNAPITIEGNASAEVVDDIKKAISDTANASLNKLNEALRINGVHSRVASNVRKN